MIFKKEHGHWETNVDLIVTAIIQGNAGCTKVMKIEKKGRDPFKRMVVNEKKV